MPDNTQQPTVSFPALHRDANGDVIAIRTVHIVVVKPQPTERKDDRKADLYTDIIFPLAGVFVLAALILWAASRIRPGKKTNRIISRFEGFNAFFDGAAKKDD